MIKGSTLTGQEKGFFVFFDRASNFGFQYASKEATSERLIESLKEAIVYVERQTGKKVKMFRWDRGPEVMNNKLTNS